MKRLPLQEQRRFREWRQGAVDEMRHVLIFGTYQWWMRHHQSMPSWMLPLAIGMTTGTEHTLDFRITNDGRAFLVDLGRGTAGKVCIRSLVEVELTDGEVKAHL